MNIYDVARLAGVSLSTASKALNGRKDVKEETRQRVIEVAKSIDYHPSHLARGLAKRRTENIGLVNVRHAMDSIIINPFYSRVIEGIEAECMERNYNMLLSVQPYQAGSIPATPKMVREKSVDGLLLLGWMPEAFLAQMAGSGIPMVGADCTSPLGLIDSVVADNAAGAVQVAEHLASLGHKRVGMLNGPAGVASFSQRREAFLGACRRLGLEARLVESGDGQISGEHGWKLPMLAEPRPTAVFCANDDHAYYFMRQCMEAGLRVPEDISIVGFDDIDMAAHYHPPLTTVRVPKRELGAKAVRRLMQLIEKPKEGRETLTLPVELIVRESTAKL